MKLYKFEKGHEFLDKLNIPRLKEYENNVIIDRVDFTKEDKEGGIDWKDDGIYLKINGKSQQGFIFNKNYRIAFYKKNPSFHLFECDAIQSFIRNGTLAMYYFWSNSALVTVTDRDTKIEYPNQKLSLCKKCWAKLKSDMKIVNNTTDFHNLLDLNDEKIKKKEAEPKVDIFGRPFNWQAISRAYRKEQNYTCEECGFGGNDLKEIHDKRYIHTHHINSNELLNTQRDNLRAVCILCHYNEDEHHRSNFEKPRMKIELINFVKSYKSKLTELKNPHIQSFLNDNNL